MHLVRRAALAAVVMTAPTSEAAQTSTPELAWALVFAVPGPLDGGGAGLAELGRFLTKAKCKEAVGFVLKSGVSFRLSGRRLKAREPIIGRAYCLPVPK